MSDYRVVFEDPDNLDAPASVLVPAPEFMEVAKAGGLPPVSVFWALQDDEEKHSGPNFKHDKDKWEAQFTAPRVGPLTEEEAIEYLIMKDIPRRVWGKQHNRPMFKIVKKDDVPSDRSFRNAWRLAS